MRVLVLDFDFFSAIGGGQTFYRRVVARHPHHEFHYPSRGPDLHAPLRGTLPANARPFGFDQFADIGSLLPEFDGAWPNNEYGVLLCRIALAWQGSSFDIVEIPSFFPAVHLIRPIFSAYGIAVGRISLGLLGWLSVSTRNAYHDEGMNEHTQNLLDAERRSIRAADIRYTISNLHAVENDEMDLPVTVVDMQDALEEFPMPPADPPGEGPPDLWYVGRLDRNKGPDLFIEMAARLPRRLFRNCYLTGPDNFWANGDRWSHRLLALATRLDFPMRYVGQLSDEDLREKVYRGRSVLVIPSRSDAFNYVAIEALANGCPLLLSKHAGAAGFLAERCPSITPPIIDPEDVDVSAKALGGLLESYPQAASSLRRELRQSALPKPRQGFMDKVWSGIGARSPDSDHALSVLHTRLAGRIPLDMPVAQGWRLSGHDRHPSAPSLSCILWATCVDIGLMRTIASLAGSMMPAMEILIVDDGSASPSSFRAAVSKLLPKARVLRQPRQGRAAAWNRGLAESQAPYLCFLEPGEAFDRWLLSSMSDALRKEEPDAVAAVSGMRLYQIDGLPQATEEGDGMPVTGNGREDAPLFGPFAIMARSAIDQTGAFDTTLDRLSRRELCSRLGRVGRLLWWQEGQAWRWLISPEDILPASSEERARLDTKMKTMARWNAIGAGLETASLAEMAL
jgi:glycosyltransferase involved in cell wall biosynthesis